MFGTDRRARNRVLLLVSFAVGCAGDDGAASGDKKERDGAVAAASDARADAANRTDDASSKPPPDAAARPVDARANDAMGAENAVDARAGDARADASGTRTDAATPGDDAGAGDCAYALCESFESAMNGALPAGWTLATGWGSGMPGVASDERHGGTKSLKSAVGVSGQPRASRSLSALGATAGKHWGRIYYKVKTPISLPSGGGVIHGTLVALQGASESRVVDTVVNSQGKHQFLYNLPDDSCCTGSAYDYASFDGAWHCAEWYVDAATQSYRFFYEGNEVTSIGFRDSSPMRSRIEQFGSVVLGWINYQMPAPPHYEVWLDDLAIDDERVGCSEAP
jgi:hypothetical protein